MKNQTSTKARGEPKQGRKLPKARAAILSDESSSWYRVTVTEQATATPHAIHFTVIPHATAKEAKELARVWNMTVDERFIFACRACKYCPGGYKENVALILAALGFPTSSPVTREGGKK